MSLIETRLGVMESAELEKREGSEAIPATPTTGAATLHWVEYWHPDHPEKEVHRSVNIEVHGPMFIMAAEAGG